MTEQRNIGAMIAELRKSAGMTQAALAEKLGVTAQAVSQWERGETMPDVLMLPVLAGVFGCTLDHLYGIPLPEKAEGEVLPAQESAGFPEDDGVYRAVLMRGGQILEIRQIPQELANGERIVLHIDGDVAGNIQSAFSVEVGGSVTVQADGCGVSADGGIAIGADAVCAVRAAGSLTVGGNVGGNAEADGNISVAGGIAGNADAGGGISVGENIGGNADAGGGISAGGDIGGNADAGAGVTVQGNVGGSINAGGSVRVSGGVDGEIRSGGKVHFSGSMDGISSAVDGISSAVRDMFSMFTRRDEDGRDEEADIHISSDDSDCYCAVLMQNGSVVAEKRIPDVLREQIVLRIEGDAGDVQSAFSVEVEGDVSGDVRASGAVSVDGDVGGDVNTSGGVRIGGDAGGDISCAGLTVGGDVSGDISCGGLTVGGDIGGDVRCGGLSVGGDVGGDVIAQGNVRIDGDVSGDVRAEKSVTVEGDVEGGVTCATFGG